MRSDTADAPDDLRWASALAESAVAIGLLRGPELLVAYANPALQAWWGWPLGVPLREACAGQAPAAEATRAVSGLAEQVIDRGEVTRDPEIPAGDGRFVSVTCSPTQSSPTQSSPTPSSPTPAGSVVDGVLVVAVDVTSHVTARRSLEEQHGRLSMIDQATAAVTADLDLHRELTALAHSVVPALADACVVYLIDHRPSLRAAPGTLRATRLICVVNPERGLAPPAPEVRLQIAARRPVTQAAVGGVPVFATGRDVDVSTWGERWLSALGPHSLLAVPFGHPEVVAVVGFYACPPRSPYQASDMAIIREISARAEVAVGHALRLQRTTEVALGLQRGLLSDPPEVAGLDIAVRYRPGGPGLEVGGDWYDAFVLPSGNLGFAIGDIVGHDLYAVSTMGQLRSMVQALACQPGADPASVLTALNRLCLHLGVGDLATVVYGHLAWAADGSGAMMTWAHAGHPPPLLVRPGMGTTVLTGAASPLLGLVETPYRQAYVRVDPGDLVVLYTDGLIEDPHRTDGDPIAELAATVADQAEHDLEQLCDRLVTLAPGHDDIALLAIRLHAAPPSSPS